MPLQFGFRFSLYLTLSLACSCLGYAELPLLPEISLFAIAVGALIVGAFFLEGRWALADRPANILGAVLMAGLALWFVVRLFRPSGSVLDGIPWPTGLLPYLGPVLMVAMTAKLFRPKQVVDFWAMHGIGLTLVALGCVLAGDGVFGVMLLLYWVSLIWSLTLFFLYRQTLTLSSGTTQQQVRQLLRSRYFLWGEAGRLFVAALIVGIIGFLLTPRTGQQRWESTFLARAKAQTGLHAEQDIDLNRSGTLGISKEVAFEVLVRGLDGQPRDDLSLETRWRGMARYYYERGRWPATPHHGIDIRPVDPQTFEPVRPKRRNLFGSRGIDPAEWDRPDLGKDRFLLEFHPSPMLRGLDVVAEPVLWEPDREVPLATVSRSGKLLEWAMLPDGTFGPISHTDSGPDRRESRPAVYRQMTRPAGGAPPLPKMWGLSRSAVEILGGPQSYPKWIRPWTDALLQRLVQEQCLSAQILDRDEQGRIRPEHQLVVMKALERHFLYSGEYAYTLKHERKNPAKDPIEEFLTDTKVGRCERFAAALTLMLRSQGIPARLIMGFKGCERVDEGRYQVRQSQAHAWVEALWVRQYTRRTEPDEMGSRPWFHSTPVLYGEWRTLDPTPSDESTDADAQLTWWGGAQALGAALFRDFILGFNSEQRHKAWQALRNSSVESWNALWTELREGQISVRSALLVVTTVGILVGLTFLVRRSRRRQRSRQAAALPGGPMEPRTTVDFYDELLQLLGRAGFRPTLSQTAAEFAQSVWRLWTNDASLREVARIPMELTSLYYRVRFGDHPLSTAELENIAQSLTHLRHTLSPPEEGAQVQTSQG